MSNYREIVTKAIIGKGRKTFTNHYVLTPEEKPTTILGCWVINHKFSGKKEQDKIMLSGTCDVNIWYSCENDTKTNVSKQTINYNELVSVTKKKESDIPQNEEIIVRSLKQPSCIKAEIVGPNIEYDIEKELGIELVGDTKMRIPVDDNEDEWEELKDDEEKTISDEIDNSVTEDFIEENK